MTTKTHLPLINPLMATRYSASIVGSYKSTLKDRADKNFTPLNVDLRSKEIIAYVHTDPALLNEIGDAALTQTFNAQNTYHTPSAC